MMRIALIASTATICAAALALGTGTASASVVECGNANGYGVSAESDTTSCGFALNVARAVPSRFSGSSTAVTAFSPASGMDYRMVCSRLYQRTLECTGGNGAAVYLNN